ncbi:thiolase family protein [Microbacterium sp.]|uniref:thiolase family protein n=1 Tax=Microbacterium sp. TaxID=51671 RepID=UPI0025FDBDEF|nr:thiolase family protein [Microbacterium sp.]
MRDVHIVGTGMTRFAKHADRGVRSLSEEAVRESLADASLTADDVGMVFFSNATSGLITGQEMIRGQSALRHTGLLGKPIINTENACASATTAVYLAWMAVSGGACEVALAVGAEKMTHPDKARTFAALGAARDLDELEAADEDPTRSPFMDIYAAKARQFMADTGATAADFAEISVKSHWFAARNPRAQYRTEVSVEEVLASREIASPLTLLMCSPVGDGAAAVVFASDDYVRRHGLADPVRVRAVALTSGMPGGPSAPSRAIAQAYEDSGVDPLDINIAEVHDAAAPAEIIAYEELRLCAPGDGVKLLRDGQTALGGRVPVNTSGGLLSKGHPVGATGCAQVVQITEQLRGRSGERQAEGARLGITHNGGGSLGTDAAAFGVTILEKV